MEFVSQATIDEIFSKHRLRYVVFQDLYRNFWRPEVQSLFGKVAALKLAGYRSKHQEGVLPLDSVDFVGTHVLICQENADGSIGEPLAGFKSVSLKTCDHYQLAFPPLELIHSCDPPAPKNHQYLVDLISRVRSSEEDLFYNGSWTVAPETRSKLPLRQVLIQGSVAMLTLYYSENGLFPLLAAAVVRFGVDDMKRSIGFVDFLAQQSPGGGNERLQSPHFSGDELKLMILNQLSEGGENLADLFRKHWQKRVILNDSAFHTADLPFAA